eukprot:gnl/Trimastix_PCT/3699.p1 GENE.gnl/Trimastix_PCT/3699~~gnl/Trimastix_PCT/3699.p1  ORF type:complete len:1197 (+),score=202.51 gnl/Trimastix_PCT/3699:534-3593(+)
MRMTYVIVLAVLACLPTMVVAFRVNYAETSRFNQLMSINNVFLLVSFAFATLYGAHMFTSLAKREFSNLVADQRTQGNMQARQRKNKRLLKSLFPPAIRAMVERNEAQSFSNAVVVFADLESFGDATAGLPPKDAIDVLNKVFALLDARAEHHHVLKIKTTGCIHLSVSNVPEVTPTGILDAISFALDGIEGIQLIASSLALPLRPRFGVHFGQIIGGVLKTSKIAFDVYGDTVNVAHRMMAHGEPGAVQISRDVMRRLPSSVQSKLLGTSTATNPGGTTKPTGALDSARSEGSVLTELEDEDACSVNGMDGASEEVERRTANWSVHPRGAIQIKHHGSMECYLITRSSERTLPPGLGGFSASHLHTHPHPQTPTHTAHHHPHSTRQQQHSPSSEHSQDEEDQESVLSPHTITQTSRIISPDPSLLSDEQDQNIIGQPLNHPQTISIIPSSSQQISSSPHQITATHTHTQITTQQQQHIPLSVPMSPQPITPKSAWEPQVKPAVSIARSRKSGKSARSGRSGSLSDSESMSTEMDILGTIRHCMRLSVDEDEDASLSPEDQDDDPDDQVNADSALNSFEIDDDRYTLKYWIAFRDKDLWNSFLEVNKKSTTKMLRIGMIAALLHLIFQTITELLFFPILSTLLSHLLPIALLLLCFALSFAPTVGVKSNRVFSFVCTLCWGVPILGQFLHMAHGKDNLEERGTTVEYFMGQASFFLYSFFNPMFPFDSFVVKAIMGAIGLGIVEYCIFTIKLLIEPVILSALVTLVAATMNLFSLRSQRSAFLRQSALMLLTRAAQEQGDESSRLLESVLPPAVLQRLKRNPRALSRLIPEATVVLADFEKFTSLCSSVPAIFIVRMLEQIYSRFDAICAQYGLTSIATIGDCYFAGAGVITPDPKHASVVTLAALDMVEAVKSFTKEQGIDLKIRCGVGTGPVFSGVLGSSRYTFDVWGPAVEEGHDMEASSKGNRVHISSRVKDQLESGVFRFHRASSKRDSFYVLRRGAGGGSSRHHHTHSHSHAE